MLTTPCAFSRAMRALEHRHAADGDQRLGHRIGQRAHALAAAGRQDHRGIDHGAPICRNSRRQQAVDPGAQRLQRLVPQRALEHAPDARQVRQVLGLAVALQQADEQADDAGMALGGHQGEAGGEVLGVEAGLAEVAGEAGGVHGGRHVAPGILDQRDQVVGGMAAAGRPGSRAGRRLARRSGPAATAGCPCGSRAAAACRRIARQVGEAGAPGGAIGRRLLVRRRPAGRRRQVPFRQQHRGIDQRLAGIGAEARQQRVRRRRGAAATSTSVARA